METKQKLRRRETSSPTGPSLEIRTSGWLQNGRAKQNEQERRWRFLSQETGHSKEKEMLGTEAQ